MNLRQLRYILAIADEGSFTRAAERLFVAQPSLSQQIKSLERELGGPLLERLPKGVRLTTAGKAFIPEARAAVAEPVETRVFSNAARIQVLTTNSGSTGPGSQACFGRNRIQNINPCVMSSGGTRTVGT